MGGGKGKRNTTNFDTIVRARPLANGSGAAAYPVRDTFQFTQIGSVVNMHGPVRWFNRHNFDPMTQASGDRVCC